MTVVKTGISMNELLFKQLEQLAAEMGVSRSHLLALAFEEYVARRQNLKLLKELNAVYGDDQIEERQLIEKHETVYRSRQEQSW